MIDLDLVLRALVVGLCGAVAFGYICRLDGMTWRDTKFTVAAYNLCSLLFVLWSAIDAFTGRPITTDRIGVVSAGLWLVISWPTWKHGIPAHAQKMAGWPKIGK